MARYHYNKNEINSKTDFMLMVAAVTLILWGYFPMFYVLWLMMFIVLVAILIFAPSPQNISNRTQRINALKLAGIYLSPYKNIWQNLKLTNKHCILTLGNDGVTIKAIEKKHLGEPYRKFRIVNTKVHSYRELWDMFCTVFDYQTTYDRLVELCHLYDVSIYESSQGTIKKESNNSPTTSKADSTKFINKNKLDINNASEIEITELPGISIVLSKKLIKKREAIGGFKTVEDVLLFLKLKPHMEEQLRCLICVKKMQGTNNIQRFEERKIDL